MLATALLLSLALPHQDPFAHALAELQGLARAYGDRLRLEEWGRSRGDRPLVVATLGILQGGEEPRALDRRPAILLVAGLDGRRADDVAVALHHLRAFCAGDAKLTRLLHARTLYVVPCANPDGLAAGTAGNGAPTDDDRDGRADEDGPDDLDGDGHIVMMRVPDPKGTWIADPDEPRWMRPAEIAAGEHGRFRLLPEGRDDDGDGSFNEDGTGGTRPDRNFPQLYPEHGAGAGRYVLSDPCALGLADLVLGKPNLQLVVCYGGHDNLLAKPRRSNAEKGRAPTGLLADDAWILEACGKAYRERTGRKGKNRDDWPGRFHAWVYAGAGLPCLATSLVDRARPAKDESPAAARLRWALAEFGDDAFVPWHEVDHPDLGKVEVGGLREELLYRIPAARLAAVEKTHLGFLVSLFDRLSRPELTSLDVIRLAGGVQEIKALVTNQGWLPPRTAMAMRLRRPRRLRVELLVPRDGRLVAPRRGDAGPALVFGRPRDFPDLGAGGTHDERRWVVRASPGQRWVLRLIQEGVVFDRKELPFK